MTLAHLPEDLGLLDGVYAEIGLQLVGRIELSGVVAGAARDHGEQLGEHVRGGHPARRRTRSSRTSDRRGGSHRRGRRSGRCHRRGRCRSRSRSGSDRLGPELTAVDEGSLKLIARQPARVGAGVDDARIALGGALPRGQRELAAKPCGEAEGVVDRVASPGREPQRAQVRIGLAQVRDRRNQTVLQRLDRDGVFDARAHRVAGEALGVGDDDLRCSRAKRRRQAGHLGGCRTPARRRVRLVGQEHAPAGKALGGLAGAPQHLLGEAADLAGDVVAVQARAVEGRVGDVRADERGHRLHAARRDVFRLLQHEAYGAHAEDHAVTTPIKRQRRVLDLGLDGRSAGREEPGADPGHQHRIGDVVRADHDDPASAPKAQPVFGDSDGLSGARAGRVDLRVRPARADVLRELAVSHRQNLEQEATIEGLSSIGLSGLRVGLNVLNELVVAGERRREHDSGVVPHAGRQHPAGRHALSVGSLAVAAHQRDPGVLQRFKAGRERKLRGDVEGAHQRGVHPVVFLEVKMRLGAGELNDAVRGVREDELALSGDRVLDEAADLLSDHRGAVGVADVDDAVFTGQHALDVVVGEHLFARRQAQRGTRTNDREAERIEADERGRSRGLRGHGRTGGGSSDGCDRRRSRARSGRRDRSSSLKSLPGRGQQRLHCGEQRVREAGRIQAADVLLRDLGQEPRDDLAARIPAKARARIGGERRRATGWNANRARRAHALARVVDERAQCAMVAQSEVRIMLQTEVLPHARDDVGELDGVDAEVGFEIEVHVQRLDRPAGLASDDLEDVALDRRRAVLHGVAHGGCRRDRLRARLQRRCRRTARRAAGKKLLVGPTHRVRRRRDRETEREQRRERVEEREHAAALGLVGVERAMRAVLEDVDDKAAQRALGTTLDEDARAIGVHALDLGDPLDRARDLTGEDVDRGVAGARTRGVVTAVDVGRDAATRLTQVQARQYATQRLGGRRDDARVEGVADRQRVHGQTAAAEGFDRRFHGLALAGDDGLSRAILVGGDDVARDLRQDRFHGLDVGRDAGHLAEVRQLHRGHLASARRNGDERVFKGQHAGRDGSAVLAEAVTRDHFRTNAERGQQAQQRDVDGQRGRLADLGLPQAIKLLFFGDRRVAPDQLGERAPELRGHHRVGFREGLRDDREVGREVEAHVDVLRALTGENKGQLPIARHIFNVHAALTEQVIALALLHRLNHAIQLLDALFFVLGCGRDPQRRVGLVGLGLTALKRPATRDQLFGRIG